ncbi:MAG: hypothetical protein ABI851_06710, partial [Saprospiraceae bacterium]
MACYLIPTIIGLGSAIIGGIIVYLINKKEQEESLIRFNDLYTNYYKDKQDYEELEKFHQLSISEANKLTEKQELLINSYRQNKDETENLSNKLNDQIKINSDIQNQHNEIEQVNNKLRINIAQHVAAHAQLSQDFKTEIANLKNELSQKPKEIIKEVEKIVEVPIEVIREVEVIKEVEKIIEVPVEIIREVEVIREVEKIVEVPVEVIREVEVIKELEKIVEIPVDVIREVEVIKEVEKIVEIPVEVLKEIEVIKEIEKIVEVPVDVIREVEVIREV